MGTFGIGTYDTPLSLWDRGLYIGTYTFGIGTYHRPLSQTDRYLSIGPYLKWIGTYTGTYPTLDRHRSGWKQQSGPRATYFVSPLHQAVAMICVSREMFTVGGGQAPRWYPRFTLGDLFATTLIVKWPG